jgi:hypothetical protein
MAKTAEPKFGFKNLIRSKREGKVKAFVSILVPTETVGSMELAGFKVIEGTTGHFISLPNRAVPITKKQAVTTAAGVVEGTVTETKYYNNIRFESQAKYNEFRDALNKDVLPLILRELSK